MKKSNSSIVESNVTNVSKNKNLVESNRSVVESTSNTFVSKNKNTIESNISESTSNTYIVDSNKIHTTSEAESNSSESTSNTVIADSDKTIKNTNKITFKPTLQIPTENHTGKTDSEKPTGNIGSIHRSTEKNRVTNRPVLSKTKFQTLNDVKKGLDANKKGSKGNVEATTKRNNAIGPVDVITKHKGFKYTIYILK